MGRRAEVALYPIYATEKSHQCVRIARSGRGWTPDTEAVGKPGEYVDVGQSGAKDYRPELNKLMDGARKRQFDAIVVWRFDRFARSTKHLLLASQADSV